MIKNYSVTIPANSSVRNPTLSGNFIRCLDSSNSVIYTRLMYKDGDKPNSEFEIEKGLGFETKNFYGVQFRNDTASDIYAEFIVSDEGAVIDTRTSGALSIGASKSVSYIDPTITTSDTVNGVEVFGVNAYRKSATFQIDADCYINSTSGIVLGGGGIYLWENQSALKLIPVAGTVNITGFDETN